LCTRSCMRSRVCAITTLRRASGTTPLPRLSREAPLSVGSAAHGSAVRERQPLPYPKPAPTRRRRRSASARRPSARCARRPSARSAWKRPPRASAPRRPRHAPGPGAPSGDARCCASLGPLLSALRLFQRPASARIHRSRAGCACGAGRPLAQEREEVRKGARAGLSRALPRADRGQEAQGARGAAGSAAPRAGRRRRRRAPRRIRRAPPRRRRAACSGPLASRRARRRRACGRACHRRRRRRGAGGPRRAGRRCDAHSDLFT